MTGKLMSRSGPCAVDGCPRLIQSRGLCNAQYQRKLLKGTPGISHMTRYEKFAHRPAGVSKIEWFWFRVDKTAACWLWKASTDKDGYGTVYWNGATKGAHRIAYELSVGPIPPGLTLDHYCRTPACVNPAHLEPVTNRVNVLRGVGASAQFARRTHCRNGHPLSKENISAHHAGWRRCNVCRRDEYRANKLRGNG